MHKILVFGMTENPGGVESFLRNMISEIPPETIQFDFLCNSYEKTAYEEELAKRGGRMVHFAARSRNYRQYRRELGSFFAEHGAEYDGIWVNVSSLANIDYLKYAKKSGIAKRIIHSHNSRNMDSRLRGLVHRWNRLWIQRYATDFWACSEPAADWFFRKPLKKNVRIIHNAIPVEKMRFSEKKREQLRAQLGFQHDYVIGNVGRLHFQKNQEFLLEVFASLARQTDRARLVLIGQGEDERRLKETAERLRVGDKVYWAGVQTDIDAWLSAFDLFVFPSLFEGMPIAALEAQANGVPVLASEEAVSDECRVNDNCLRLSLKSTADLWAGEIAAGMDSWRRADEETIRARFRENGYDIHAEVEKVEQLLCC